MSLSGKKSTRKLQNSYSNVDNTLIEFNKERMKQTYAFPATMNGAQIHFLASKYGYNPPAANSKEKQAICSCCKQFINTQQLPLNYTTTPDIRSQKMDETIFKLSSGISLFFTFIKMAICYLILRFLLTDAFNLFSSIAGTYCRNNSCDSIFTSQISAYNKIQQQNLLFALDILNLVTIIFSIAYFNFYRKVQYKIQNLINGSQSTQDDYTLFMTNIPILLIDQEVDPDKITFDYADRLKRYMEQKIDEWLTKIKDIPQQNLEQIEKELIKLIKNKSPQQIRKITSVSMCFDLSEMQILRDMRNRLMEKYVDVVKKRQKNNENNNKLIEQENENMSYQNIPTQIKLINFQQIFLCQKFAQDSSMAFNLTHFVGRAFISFEYQHFRDYILRQYERNKQFLKIKPDYPMKVSLANAPSDILWFNMNVQGSTRLKNIIISYLILIMVLTFAFAGVLGLTKLKYEVNTNKSTHDDFWGLILPILMTVVTLAINSILGQIVKHLTEYQRHQTKSKFVFSHIIKTVITQFINTSIIYYVSSSITKSPYLSEQGLVLQVSSLFLTSAVIQIALNLINPMALISQFKRYFLYKNLTEVNMFQKHFNSQIEQSQFDIVDRYSYYILQIFACSFYSYLAPIATPCLIATFTIQYWIDKFILFRRSSFKNDLDFFLSRTILKIFECSLFIFALGNYIFSIVLHNSFINPVNIASLIITALYTLFITLAPRHLQKRIFGSYEQIEDKTYSSCLRQGLFISQYWTSNPATQFVKQIDINTKQEVTQKFNTRLAGENELIQAKKVLDQMVENDDISFNGSSSDKKSAKEKEKAQQ